MRLEPFFAAVLGKAADLVVGEPVVLRGTLNEGAMPGALDYVYNDPVVKYGYARGTEPVAYVDVILDRFEHYKQFVEKEPPAEAESPAEPAEP